MKGLLFLLTIVFSQITSAQDSDLISESLISTEKSQFGVSASAAGGFTSFTIDAPKGRSIYSGYGLDFRLNLPIWQNDIAAINTDLTFSYFDTSNNANTGVSKEFVRMLGPGIGINFNLYRLLLGANYHALRSQHFWLGNDQGELNYTLNAITYFAGIHFSINDTMQILFSQNITTGNLPASKTNFGVNAPFSASTFWIHLTYSSGKPFVEFFEKLFK